MFGGQRKFVGDPIAETALLHLGECAVCMLRGLELSLSKVPISGWHWQLKNGQIIRVIIRANCVLP